MSLPNVHTSCRAVRRTLLAGAAVASTALTVSAARAVPLLIDVGDGGEDLASGYRALGARAAYTDPAGVGWVSEEPGLVRFCYGDEYDSPEQWKKDASRVEGTSTFFSPEERYWGYVGGMPFEADGSFVYEFAFPLPIGTLEIFDTHTAWGHKGLNKVVMSTSTDGETWTERHNDPTRYYSHHYRADLSEELAGKRRLFVRYSFHPGDPSSNPVRSHARLDSFGMRGTLRRTPPSGFYPGQRLARVSDHPLTDGPFHDGEKGDLLVRDGAVIVHRATLRVHVPAGRYYVETVSSPADYDLLVDGEPVNPPHLAPWRTGNGVRTVAGRVAHGGGALDLTIRSRGRVVRLCGVRILPDRSDAWPARFEAGRLVLTEPSDDPAVAAGMSILEDAGFVHTAEATRTAVAAFSKVADPDLRSVLIVLAGVQPNVTRYDRGLAHAKKALDSVLEEAPLNLVARDLRDDLDRLVLGEHKYHRYWWEEAVPGGPVEPIFRALKGRAGYHAFMERGRTEELRKQYQPLIQEALEHYPNDVFLRMYNLERVAWGEEYTTGGEGAPRWAALQRELLGRTLHVVHWWIDNRQRRDGSFGGGLNDDVEALRSWPIAILTLSDRKAQAAAQKLSDGVWRSGALVNGYSRELWDIQHSAEESSDTQPQFIGVRYGDPEWIWRNMRTLTCMRDVWTAVNPLGFRHFRSAYVSATEVDTSGTRGVDVPYATRAAKHGHWLAWYARFTEPDKLMTEWARAWATACMRTDRGKPRGVPPAAVDFETGQLGGKGPNWYSPKLGWSYFDWPGKVDSILDQLLLAYTIDPDPTFVAPFPAMLELIRRHRDADASSAAPGSEAWAATVLLGRGTDPSSRSVTRSQGSLDAVFGKWRVLTGDSRFDDLLREVGDFYVRYVLTGDTAPLEEALHKALEKGVNQYGLGAMRYNLPMLTSEVKHTDRIFLAGHDVLSSMYGGSPGSAVYCPAHAVTWEDTGPHVAALVRRADPERLVVRAYCFEEKAKEIGMRVWRMPRGRYRLTVRADEADETPVSREVRIRERGDRVDLRLPPRQEMRIELKLVEAEPASDRLPDLAVARRDITLTPQAPAPGSDATVSVKVHNIGSADAGAFVVKLFAVSGEHRRDAAELPVEGLACSRRLLPATTTLTAQWRFPDPKPERLRVSIEYEGQQITVRNDAVELEL